VPRNLQPLTISIPPALRADLQALADRELTTLSHVVRRACISEIERRRDRAVLRRHEVAQEARDEA
jgi:hypothetical protein